VCWKWVLCCAVHRHARKIVSRTVTMESAKGCQNGCRAALCMALRTTAAAVLAIPTKTVSKPTRVTLHTPELTTGSPKD
jgi:hypothetical protein